MSSRSFSRRTVLKAAPAAALAGLGANAWFTAARAAAVRPPGTLPDHRRPPGTPDPTIPIEHIVVVMQENHSFDEYLGMLPLRGQPHADGFRFDAHGTPTNWNPRTDGSRQTVFRRPSLCPGPSAGQSWNSSHRSINNGRMDGFARLEPGSMGYFDEPDIPFYYSLAKTFTLANRWFCSVPAQTYPNRRFLYAGTAYGDIATDSSTFFQPPPAAGTIMDQLSHHGISWRDYVTDLPDTAIIPSNLERYPVEPGALSGELHVHRPVLRRRRTGNAARSLVRGVRRRRAERHREPPRRFPQQQACSTPAGRPGRAVPLPGQWWRRRR